MDLRSRLDSSSALRGGRRNLINRFMVGRAIPIYHCARCELSAILSLSVVSERTSARRSSVYPSYPKDAAPENISKALIVSYCWTQDAERMGALINGDGTGKPELIDLVFRDLAAVHGVTVEWLKQFYKDGDYFAWDWLHDPLTMGSSFLPEAFLTLLNGSLRWIRVLWSCCVWKRGYLQRNATAPRERQTLLRWRSDQRLPCVCGFVVDSLSVLLIQTLPKVGLPVLWIARGVPLTNTSPSTSLRASSRSSGRSGAKPSTGMKLPTRN